MSGGLFSGGYCPRTVCLSSFFFQSSFNLYMRVFTGSICKVRYPCRPVDRLTWKVLSERSSGVSIDGSVVLLVDGGRRDISLPNAAMPSTMPSRTSGVASICMALLTDLSRKAFDLNSLIYAVARKIREQQHEQRCCGCPCCCYPCCCPPAPAAAPAVAAHSHTIVKLCQLHLRSSEYDI